MYGADGFPFNRSATGTSLLVAFLNVGHRVLSCNHNNLVMGGNCEEDSEEFLKFTHVIAKEMKQIEEKSLFHL